MAEEQSSPPLPAPSSVPEVTVRLSEDEVIALPTLARFDGVALAEEIREGVELLLAARRDDPVFLALVQDSFEQAYEILGSVEGGDDVIEALRPRTLVPASEVSSGEGQALAALREVEQELSPEEA